MANKEVMRNNPVFDRTGVKPNYATKIAAQFNWKRRALLGVIGQLQQNLLWAEADPEWATLSEERRAAIRNAYRQCELARKQCQAAETAIDDIKKTMLYAPELVAVDKKLKLRETNRRSQVGIRSKKGT